MARVYINPPVQQKQRVYISGPKVGAPQTKQRVYVSGPQTGQVAQPKILQPSKTGFSGLAQNAKTDFGSFAKGILGLGRQAVTHPIDTTEKVYGIGKEIVKGVPAGARLMAHTMANFPETQRQGIAALKQLHQTPLEDQKKALNELLQKIGESPEAKANPDKRRLAQLGTAIMGNYTQYSRPGEKIYNEPFSFALDAIPMAKSLGVGNVVASGASKARSLPVVSKAVDTAQDLFIPGSKLKRAGYGKVAEDLQKTGTAMRQSQEGIIKSTVSQFKDLTKEERGQFFDAIDSLRRTPDVAPSHPNPKVQAKIDWYMNEELPKIQKMAGYRPKGTDVPTSPQSPLLQEAGKNRTQSVDELIKSGYTPSQAEFIARKSNEMMDMKSPSVGEVVKNIDKYTVGTGNAKEVYRVVPKGKGIEPADFVFANKEDAIKFRDEHGYSRGQSEIVSMKVSGNELLTPKNANLPGEHIYLPSDLYNKAQGGAESPLLQEAGKYKSAEELGAGLKKPLYHDTTANGIMGILKDGRIDTSYVPFGGDKSASFTANPKNYSRPKAPFRIVVDDVRGESKFMNDIESEHVFTNPVSISDVKEISIDITNPYTLDSLKGGRLDEVMSLAKEKGIKVSFFESNRFGGGEAEQLTKKQLTDLYNKAQGGTPPIQNYLHHLFTPSKETSMGGKLSAPQRGFLKQSKDVEGFVKDPVVSIAAVKSKAATANIKEGFIQRVTSQYARPAETVTEFKNGTILAKDTGEPLIKWKGQYLPKDLGEELLRYEGKGHTIVDTMLTPLRVFNRNWKPLATAVRPRYHLRNVIGNVYNASFVGGAGLHRYPEAVWQQMKGHIATQMKEGTFSGQVYSALFKTPPEHKMIKMATEDGVIGKGFFAADINDLAEIANTTEDFAKAISKMENPAEIYRIPVLRQWLQGSTAIGQAFEDNARLALYISQLKSGATRATAKAYVNKHLFDYINGLGEGDRAIKAIIPFWSWTRFNVPLQYGALWKNPIRNVVAQEFGKPYVQQSEQNNPEYQFLSQREKDLGAFKIGETTKDGKTSDKYMRTQGVLPVQDVSKVFDPENAGLSPLFGMLNQAYRHVSPPTNPSQNLDYFGRPVEQYPGEVKNFLGMPVRGTTKEILQGIPALSELNKGIGGSYNDANRPDLASRMGTIFSPTSNTIQDREKNRQYVESDYNTLVKGDFAPGLESNFKFVIKGLLENPSDAVLNENKNTLANLLKQQGYTDEGIKILVKKSIESVVKDRATIDMPGKAKSIINQVEVNNILGKANKLNSFYTK